MRKALRILAPAALLVAGLAVTGAEAAPAGTGLAPLKTLPEASSVVEKTYWVRRCYRGRYGRLHCYRVWVRPHRHYRRW
jgi:hypothetical protein